MNRLLLSVLFLLLFSPLFILSAQDAAAETQVPLPEEKGSFFDDVNIFIENKIVFALSVPDGAFGMGSTINAQYTLPFKLSIGLEAGYYGFRSEIEQEDGAPSIIGGFTMIPVFVTTSYNFRILENFYISPVLKVGGTYLRSRINGWLGGDSFAFLFEGGGRVSLFLKGGLLLEGSVAYTGVIEKSGIFSIMNLGLGFGF